MDLFLYLCKKLVGQISMGLFLGFYTKLLMYVANPLPIVQYLEFEWPVSTHFTVLFQNSIIINL